ncbi:MAG: hypothetical protein NXI01_09370 [Gammaproteobacteria bacterium]|nr:hypothetical protein [Gammaproteobacteria bacterium]
MKTLSRKVLPDQLALDPAYETAIQEKYALIIDIDTSLAQSPKFEHQARENEEENPEKLENRLNPGFCLAIYRDPRFQHWLLQAALLTIILTAAFIAAAFMMQSSVLPLAVSAVTAGLSKVAADKILHTAVAVGMIATGIFTASIHVRFFSKPSEGGSGEAPGPSSQPISN